MVQFDAALAFVVLLLLLSLVVTALVQAAIAFFDIRGGNLKSAITTILRQAGVAQDVEAVADRVVKYPALRGALYRAKAVSKEELLSVLKELKVTETSVQEGVERWFQPVMDRSSDWFVAKSRGWTVAFSLALSLGLGVDAIDTYGRLVRDPGLRANLIASADAVTRQAEQTLDGAPVRLAVAQVAASGTAAEALRDVPLELLSCRQVDGWLASKQPAPSAAVREEFRKVCEADSRKMLTGSAANLTGLSEQLRAGGIDLSGVWSKPAELNGRKILGMLLTGILLSLGAPFWFGALRQIATLRPIIADKTGSRS